MWYKAPFHILEYTYCAAVLTENGFMDSEASLVILESDEGSKPSWRCMWRG